MGNEIMEKNRKQIMTRIRAVKERKYEKIDWEHREKKQEHKDTKDTIERQDIHEEIVRLIGYGLPKTEVVERLTEKFANSKYQIFFEGWIEDQYAKIKPNDASREDGLSR